MFFVHMNVLNIHDVERELAKMAAAAIHPQANLWFKTVARNHILSKLDEKDAEANFCTYNLKGSLDPLMPPLETLPAWAKKALAKGKPVHWFDRVQTRRRVLWQTLDMILLWFNTFKATDTRLRRLDRINFDTAAKAGALWFKNISENVWLYVKDKPPVVKSYDHGFHWVRLVTPLHFEREGRLQKHCIGNGSYYEDFRRGLQDFYSLRDAKNVPHVTMAVAKTNTDEDNDCQKMTITQCKGHGNSKAAPVYQRYIRLFIVDMGFLISSDRHLIDLEG